MQTQFVVHMRGAHQIASGHKTPLPWRLDPVRSTWSLSDSRYSPVRFHVFVMADFSNNLMSNHGLAFLFVDVIIPVM